jgi:lipoprotein-anchoring transpeptidase ErfK/SrfK
MKSSTCERWVMAVFFMALAVFCEAAPKSKARPRADLEAATRLQVFLDRAEFTPGKIDGHYGEFTLKALALYREAHGGAETLPPVAAGSAKAKKETAPDVSGLDLASIEPVFTTYTVTEADLQSVGEMPSSIPEQAKQKWLPYRTAAEAIAEKFHTDVDFLAELNPGKTEHLKAGDAVTVPNVEPFELTAVKDLKPGSDLAANEREEEAPREAKKGSAREEPTNSVRIDTKTNMLSVHNGEKLLAAYPVTIGSDHLASPIGEWKIRGIEKMPRFRYDKAMLNKGERSSDFHMLPPGPNNPVGVLWIALNKKGIGVHGTDNPDRIGRSASHGCVRLANWDVVRLAEKVKAGETVVIQ